MFRTVALTLARQAWLRKLILRTPILRDLAGRFVGGDTLESGLAAARELNRRGARASLNFHGMHIRDAEEAIRAADETLEALRRIREDGLDADVSVKLTKIGMDVDPDLCRTQLGRILEGVSTTGSFAWVDAEEAVYLEATHRLIEEMLDRHGSRSLGLVVQSYLRNRSGDLVRLMGRGIRIRLVKGGYRESRDIAYQARAEVDAAFRLDIERLLARGTAPAIATHDEEAIAWTLALRERLGLAKDAFEFQMLHGVKPALQARLIAEGYQLRCYVPYGGDWTTHLVGCLRRLPAGALERLARPLSGTART